MAFLVIGGLITSTLLSLLVTPVVYRGVDDIVNWLHHLIPNRRETLTVGVDIYRVLARKANNAIGKRKNASRRAL